MVFLAPHAEGFVTDFVRPMRPVPLRLIAGKGHYESVIAAVRGAKRSVWIATANLKELMVEPASTMPGRRSRERYHSVLDAFEELASRGVELRMLHAALPSGPFRESFDGHPKLVAGGIDMRLCPRVHFKIVVVDGTYAYLGSANWTGAGLGAKGEGRRNFELGIATSDEAMLDEVQALFDEVFEGRSCSRCKLRDACEAPIDTYAGRT